MNITKTIIATTLLVASSLSCARTTLPCFIVGDSIAQGTYNTLKATHPSLACEQETVVGINTRDALDRYAPSSFVQANTTVISMGVNDRGTSLPTKGNLEALRSRITSPQVIWILPVDNDKKAAVLNVADKHHDLTLNVDTYISTIDHTHPTNNGYRYIANQVANLMTVRADLLESIVAMNKAHY